MIAHLNPDRYRVRDIYIDKLGQWHADGRPSAPERVLRQTDVALLPLHGEYGESGEVQSLLERFGVRYAGPGAFAVSQARHKAIGKALAEEAGLATPRFDLIVAGDDVEAKAHEVIRAFHQPVVVKPVAWSSSVGTSVVGGYAPVLAAIKDLLAQGAEGVLVEEMIRGKGASAGVVEGLRGEALYALPPIEMVGSQAVCPGRFTHVEAEELARAARLMHRLLGQRHYSRSDFVVGTNGKVYYLATASAPAVGLASDSRLSQSLAAIGVAFKDFLDHLIAAALA
jgi:D-alanine-D-alanine ligase